ncbi:HAD-IB family phosphatase, partial [Candidatus Woesearchaeota archaeon]|nr:HAD-IB family phosphatase [Candidatus Woesearchaeota archaeon]
MVKEESLENKMVRLVCFDMDGVIFESINFWMEVHKKLGTYEEGVSLTKEFLKTDYQRLVDEVVGRLWKGKNADAYYELVNTTKYVKGVGEVFKTLKEEGYLTAIISAGSLDLAKRAQNNLGIDYIYANELIIEDNIIIGGFKWP